MWDLYARRSYWLTRATTLVAVSWVVAVSGCGGDDADLFGPEPDGGSDHSAPDARDGHVPDSSPSVDGTDALGHPDAADTSVTDAHDASDTGADHTDGAPAATCSDLAKNGSETDVDCGGDCAVCGDGGACSACEVGERCLIAQDCRSGVCDQGTLKCAAPTCSDHVKNGNETAEDCGGSCAPNSKCADGKVCLVDGDCQSSVCDADSKKCAVPSCTDTAKNGNETDKNCGGTCPGCDNTLACVENKDCKSNICKAKVCVAASCTNLLKDTHESDVDCGGSDCGPCDDGLLCLGVDANCKSGKCGVGNKCAAPSCPDGVMNGDETDKDCGGSCATKCDLGKACNQGSDCKSGLCPQGLCAECIVATTCSGTDAECHVRTCDANKCGIRNEALNTQLATQVAGDCKVRVCDGNGDVTSSNSDGDVPVDGKECTSDQCSSGSASNPPVLSGILCTENSGHVCDGNGACVACNVGTDCPGQDTDCQTRTCSGHVCGVSNALATKAISTQTAGDCHTTFCDGSGGVSPPAVNDLDIPVDGNPCTDDLCNGGVASNPTLPNGSPCSGGVCNGTVCGECNDASTCPGTDTDCHTRTCLAHVCGISNALATKAISAQTAGDCHTTYCDGSGGVSAPAVDDSDLPVDTNQCTTESCSGGTPASTPLTGTTCSQLGGSICSAGTCVECNAASDCPGSDTECHQRTCSSHTCGVENIHEGLATSAGQTANDCQEIRCIGGTPTSVAFDSDAPVDDGNACTDDQCSGGTPVHPAKAAGTVCGGVQGGRCKSSTCTPTFMVVRVGDGSITPFTSAGFRVFLERRYFDLAGGEVPGGSPVALPSDSTDAGGPQPPFVLSGTGDSDGSLSLSGNGGYVTLAGYLTTPQGGSSVVNSATVPRGVARVNAAGNVDTTTRFATAYATNNIRGATSSDGLTIWASGAGSGGTGGIWSIAFGTTGGTQLTMNNPPTDAGVVTPLANTRVAHVIGGQLYATSNQASNPNVFTVGSGLPTSGTVTVTTLPGMEVSPSTASPYSFVLLDRDGTPGPDTLYVADSRTSATGGGIQKWVLSGGTWSLTTTFNHDSSGATMTGGMRHVAGMITGNSVTLVAITGENANIAQTRMFLYVDDGNSNPTPALLSTAASGMFYRGVAMAP